MEDLKQPGDFLRQMHELGKATKDLIARHPTAAGTATGGTAQQPPPTFTPAAGS